MQYLYDGLQIIINDLINNQYELKEIVLFLKSILEKNENGSKSGVIKEAIEAVKEQIAIETRKRDINLNTTAYKHKPNITDNLVTARVNRPMVNSSREHLEHKGVLHNKIKEYRSKRNKARMKINTKSRQVNKKGRFIRLPHMTGKRKFLTETIGNAIKDKEWKPAIKTNRNWKLQSIINKHKRQKITSQK